MKTITSIVTVILLTTNLVFGKNNTIQITETRYSAGFSQIASGSGHGIGYTLNGGITKGRKALEVGLVYSGRESRISGGDFRYRILLGNLNKIQANNKIFSPYLQYNLTYQKGMSYTPDIVDLGSETYTVPSDPGIISTMGHYLGYGNKIRLFERVYFDTSFGLGIYQGSLDKTNGPDTWGIHNKNYGFTYAFKVGFGYAFN